MFDKIWGVGRVFETRDTVFYLFRGFSVMGINPTPKYMHSYYMYAVCMFVMAFVISPLSFNLCYILESRTMDTNQLLTSLQGGMNAWGVPIKIFILRLALHKLRRAEPLMAKLDARCQRTDELAKVRQLTMTGNRTVLAYYCIFWTSGLFTFLCNIGSGRPTFSLYLYFIDWRSSRDALYRQHAIEFLVVFTCLTHQAINDCYAVVYIFILRTHINILIERVRRLGTDPRQSKQQAFEELVQCIADHQCILDIYDIVSPVISATVFVQFLITALILCTTMINILVFAQSVSAQFAAFFYFCCVLMQIGVTCYQATLLMEDNELLPVAIFQSNWPEQDQRFRKLLIFFIQRAQKPLSLMAMKLFPITVQTCVNIAKFSFTLYTFINEMDVGDNFQN